MDKVIFLIDMNAYFASVEQSFNPALRNKCIAVCGEGRSVVTAASYEAKAFGVKTGMSARDAKANCPQIILVPGDMNRYISTTHKIHEILLRFSNHVEPFSIDESFVDVSSLCSKKNTPKNIAINIKNAIKDELGLLCSIGIGPNKPIAKIASKLQKPDGLVEVSKETMETFLKNLSIENLQGSGVGRKTQEKLTALGIRTAKDLGDTPISLLISQFGVLGNFLKDLGNGDGPSDVADFFCEYSPKSIGNSKTLPKDTKDKTIIKSYLMMLCQQVGRRLRENNMCAQSIHFFVRFNDFTSFGIQSKASEAINTADALYKKNLLLLENIFPLQKSVRLVGVTVGTLNTDNNNDFLFPQMQKQKNLEETIYNINKKFGAFCVKPMSLMVCEKYGLEKNCGMVNKELLKGS